MKKYIFILFATWCHLNALAQNVTEKIKFSVHENNTEYSIRSSFPIERAERLRAIVEDMLGEATKSSGGESQWNTSAYNSRFWGNRFEANLDKKKATAHQIALLKELTTKLQEALDQPRPPKPPKQP